MIRKAFLLVPLLVTVLFSTLRAQETADDLVKAAVAADERMESQQALDLFRKADQLKPNDAFILQRISKELSDTTFDVQDLAEKKRLITEALAYAERAVKLNPKSAVNVLSLAICHGKLAIYSDTRPKVTLSRMVKDEAERAIALDPNYDWAHHVLGRWNYEVVSLGGVARFFVRLVYGGLPDASCEEAVSHLKRAVELSPQIVSHQIELGFAYLACGKKDEARAQFQRGLALPSIKKYDQEAKFRATKALAGMK